jgi:hypothetical protein
LLDANRGLANAWIGKRDGGSQTPVLIAVDWPGHFPNVAQTIAAIAAAGESHHCWSSQSPGLRPG